MTANWLALGLLAYMLHEMGHVLAALVLRVPIVDIRLRRLGLAITRRRVGGWRDRAVTGAGMAANLTAGWWALTHGEPWWAFCNLFMVVGTQIGISRHSDLWRMMHGYERSND